MAAANAQLKKARMLLAHVQPQSYIACGSLTSRRAAAKAQLDDARLLLAHTHTAAPVHRLRLNRMACGIVC